MMTAQMTTDTKQTITKAAGWLYFLIILSSILSLVFLGGKFNVLGDSAASVSKMAQHENLVRINAVYEVFMFSAVIALAVLLFELTRGINAGLARTAMLLRVGEAILGYLGIVLSLGVLAVASQGAERSEALAVLLYDLKDLVYKVLMICISLGTIIYFSLFLKGRYIPKFMSVWGIIGFALMLVASVLQILDSPTGTMVNAAAAVLAITFELTIGIWFIVKGINQTGPIVNEQ